VGPNQVLVVACNAVERSGGIGSRKDAKAAKGDTWEGRGEAGHAGYL
jgi:hypothetical protein